MRQGANSAVRFTTYTTLKQLVQGAARPGQQLPAGITFGIGAVAGLVTVYVTQPLEYVVMFYSLCLTYILQRHQNAYAVVDCTAAVPKLVPLCLPNLNGGRSPSFLDGHHPKTC